MVLVCGVATVFLYWASYTGGTDLWVRSFTFSETTQAQVIQKTEKIYTSKRTTYNCVLKYKFELKGRVYKGSGELSKEKINNPCNTIEENLKIVYNPDNPNDNELLQLWLSPESDLVRRISDIYTRLHQRSLIRLEESSMR
ncbi:hypothetical protein HMPREF0044_0297 [Gleimia coleocanis DSM 15436]|uniref:Uncharacterized protein n=2 Tax=Gleimia TaxID=2692113 RepID=C0VYQ7_9ACTO|nr:hypothetical protein HMPREF0044_0297 [Gleimia coleocanis DSM 15436]